MALTCEFGDRMTDLRGLERPLGALVAHALDKLWENSDFTDPGEPRGCCHVCCAPCAALLYLDNALKLDELARLGEDPPTSFWWTRDRLDNFVVYRPWLYRQWAGSEMQEQCGHTYAPPSNFVKAVKNTRGRMPVGPFVEL